ncbi:MAG TPA: hypothetical protein VKF15_04985 [Nitrososphaerales archaeon]|nr:hypothetical protein [Nitrososphaerales archaeon]
MGDWREETESDLKDAESRLSALEDSLSGDPTGEQVKSTWRAYVDVEKSIAFIKVELDSESPGLFVNKEVYKVPDERQAIRFALAYLRRGAESFASGDLQNSLKQLRESRNYLRVLLIGVRRSRAKRKKTAGRG